MGSYLSRRHAGETPALRDYPAGKIKIVIPHEGPRPEMRDPVGQAPARAPLGPGSA
jgi:hypothetical protein